MCVVECTLVGFEGAHSSESRSSSESKFGRGNCLDKGQKGAQEGFCYKSKSEMISICRDVEGHAFRSIQK